MHHIWLIRKIYKYKKRYKRNSQISKATKKSLCWWSCWCCFLLAYISYSLNCFHNEAARKQSAAFLLSKKERFRHLPHAIGLFFLLFLFLLHSKVPPLGIQWQCQDSKCTNCCISSSALKWETLKKESLIDLHKRLFKCYSCFHSDTAINTDRIDWIWTHPTSLVLKTISFVLSNWNGLMRDTNPNYSCLN